MSLKVGCPRCASPVIRSAAGWECLDHGRVEPLWRPKEVSYDAFADHLRASTAVPTYLPWPLSPGWQVTDFACVGAEPEKSSATMTCCSGTSALDGPVDVLVVTEEPGVGLGARIAGTGAPDPGADVHAGQPAVRVRIERQLGYKMAKYLRRIELVDDFSQLHRGKGSYWADHGYDWYAGI